jgi:hypothetical protein
MKPCGEKAVEQAGKPKLEFRNPYAAIERLQPSSTPGRTLGVCFKSNKVTGSKICECAGLTPYGLPDLMRFEPAQQFLHNGRVLGGMVA